MRKGRIIDSHAHLVQYIAGTGAGGELRSIGNGMAVYANGQTVRMIPKEFGGDQVTPEHLIQVMDRKGSSAPGQFLWISEFLHPSGS